MLYRHTLKLAAATMAVAAFCSCSKSETASDESFEFKTYSAHEVYRLDNTAKVFMTDNDVCYEDSASLILPMKINGRDVSSLRDSIIKTAFDTVAAPGDAMKSFFKKVANESGYNAVLASDTVPRSDTDGMSLVQGEIFSMSTDMLTYRVTDYEYMPAAAHGLTTSQFITYYIPGDTILTLNSLFTPEGLEKLPAMLRQRATQLAPPSGPPTSSRCPLWVISTSVSTMRLYSFTSPTKWPHTPRAA